MPLRITGGGKDDDKSGTYIFNFPEIYEYAAAAKLLQSCPTLCDPIDAAHLVPPTLGFSRQEHWSGLPFPSPMHESEVAQSCPTLRDPMDCGLPGSSFHVIFQKSSGVGCYCLLHYKKVKKKRISESRCICMPELEVWGGQKFYKSAYSSWGGRVGQD